MAFIFLCSAAFAPFAAGAPPYEGYEQDRTLLRDTYHYTSPPLNASSIKAIEAAHRLFSKITFAGLTRKEVIAILGDPKTISDYGVAAAPTPDSPLHYRFDGGYGGWEYVIEFRQGIATGVKKEGIN
jgi:hypothetical protein